MNTWPRAKLSIRSLSCLLAGVACAFVMAGCVGAPAESAPRAAQSGAAPQTPSTPALGSTQPVVHEIYAIPAARATDDAAIYSRALGANQGEAAAADILLGTGTDVLDVQAVSPDARSAPVLEWHRTPTADTVIARPGESDLTLDAANVGAAVASLETSNLPAPRTALESGGVRYVQMGGVVVAARGASIVASYPLPTLAIDPSAGSLPAGYKGVYSGVGVGTVSALVPTTAGDVVAFSFTGRAAAVTDLMTGRSVSMSGYSTLGSAVRTVSNRLLVLAWSALDQTRPISILELDPNTLQIVATVSTGLRPTNHLRDSVLPGLSHDAVISVSEGDDTTGVDLQIWTIDGAVLTHPATLPLNSGLEIAPAGATSVYVYNGPAKNTVGRLDLVSGSYAPDMPGLRAPVGAYVVGVLTS